jgi:3-oxoadipate enol-lactonase
MRRTVVVDGGRVRVRDSGDGAEPIVAIHGDWTDSGIWDPVAKLLRERFRVIAYDEPGYGNSPPPTAAYTRAGNLRALLDRFDIKRAALVAHSGGASAAIGLALDEPEIVSSLILIAPGTHDYPWPEDDPYVRDFAAGDAGFRLALALRTWSAAKPADPVIRAQFRRVLAGRPKIGVLQVDGPPVYERLSEVTTPTTVVVGDREYPMVAASSADIAERIPDASLTKVKGADHMLPWRTPDKLADIIVKQAGQAGPKRPPSRRTASAGARASS